MSDNNINNKSFNQISQDDAESLQSLFEEIDEKLTEFKHICRQNMSRGEYEQFKYRTLGHIEPAIREESEWCTKYSSLDSLEKVAQNAMDNTENADDEDQEEEDQEED